MSSNSHCPEPTQNYEGQTEQASGVLRCNSDSIRVIDPVNEANELDQPAPVTRWKANQQKYKEIFTCPLNDLRGTTLDLSSYATENRFRFIDSEAWTQDQVLKIYETRSLPNGRDMYSTISYVWYGLVADKETLEQDGWFRVYCGTRTDGSIREDGGPVSLRVLTYACEWSYRGSTPLLWLDRLCILQTSRRDKTWQIRRMYDVYLNCEACIVLPGGLQRLASVYDETSWAQRAWTFQEAIACWQCAIVFTCDWYFSRYRPAHWLVPEECHWEYLPDLFVEGGRLLDPVHLAELSKAGSMSPVAAPARAADAPQQVVLLLGRDPTALNTLGRISEYLTMNDLPDTGGETIPEHDIRQLLLLGVQMRTSSRPVDMVFSIVGLIGIEDDMDLSRFRAHDRFKATLALVECIFRIRDTDDDITPLPVEQEPPNVHLNNMFDVPLWVHVERTDVDHLPSLHELASLLDVNPYEVGTKDSTSVAPSLRCTPVEKWDYDVELTKDEPAAYASTIAHDIPTSLLLEAYHAYDEGPRIFFTHQTEGLIELRRALDISKESNQLDVDVVLADLFVFGWTLQTQGNTFVRFYKFDVSHLIL